MRLLKKRIRFSLALSLVSQIAWAAPTSVPTKAVEVQLDGDVKVAGEQVVLGDVATIYAKDIVNFKALSALILSKIPDDSKEVRLPAGYVEARIRAALPPGEELALRAPAEIVFHLQRLGISAHDFAAEVERQARVAGKAPQGAELEIEPLSGLDQLKTLSLTNARIEPSAEMAQWKGELSFKVIRTDGAGNPPPLWVRARVRWFQNAWVATRQVAFSEAPRPAQFALSRVETTSLREEPVSVSEAELGTMLQTSKLRRPIAANAPLLPSSLERRPDAMGGSSLRIVFVSESGVRVSADGQLVGPGLVGEDVKARLKSSKKMITGRLVSQGLVEVDL